MRVNPDMSELKSTSYITSGMRSIFSPSCAFTKFLRVVCAKEWVVPMLWRGGGGGQVINLEHHRLHAFFVQLADFSIIREEKL
jgi:hypothetical protein